jgi:hypothetical protein
VTGPKAKPAPVPSALLRAAEHLKHEASALLAGSGTPADVDRACEAWYLEREKRG